MENGTKVPKAATYLGFFLEKLIVSICELTQLLPAGVDQVNDCVVGLNFSYPWVTLGYI